MKTMIEFEHVSKCYKLGKGLPSMREALSGIFQAAPAKLHWAVKDVSFALKAGECRDVTVTLDESAFTVVNDAGERISGGDAFDLYVGLSQPDDRSAELMGMAPLHAVIRL